MTRGPPNHLSTQTPLLLRRPPPCCGLTGGRPRGGRRKLGRQQRQGRRQQQCPLLLEGRRPRAGGEAVRTTVCAVGRVCMCEKGGSVQQGNSGEAVAATTSGHKQKQRLPDAFELAE